MKLLEETGKPMRKGFGAKKAAAKKVAAKKAAVKKAPAKKAAKKPAAKKVVARKAVKKAPAKNAARPYSADLEPAKPLLTAAKVEPGKKRVVKKPSREDAPF